VKMHNRDIATFDHLLIIANLIDIMVYRDHE
jgi:hypothetical protein